MYNYNNITYAAVNKFYYAIRYSLMMIDRRSLYDIG